MGDGLAPATAAAPLRLPVGDNGWLIIVDDGLLLPANTAADKSSRSSCASFLAEKSCKQQHIPFYDILWAELAARTLHLHYAHRPSTTMIRPQEWLCELSEADEDSEAIAPEAFVQALLSRAYGAAQPRKRALVLVNPHSGTGDAVFKWNRHVRPLLEAARLHLDPVILERGGEATELAEKVDIDRYDTIVACSGDGTPHEIFNGLARRPDAHTALSKIAVSQIPCGSGNAMACNLYGSHHPTHAALAIIKGVVTPMDLISITQADRRIISFLSQSLGLIAESDLGTESLRWMGEARFVIGILTRVFRQRCYPCDLAVKVEVADKEDVRQHYRRHTAAASSRRSAPLRRRREGDSGIGSDSGSGGGVSSRSNGSMSSNGNMGDANAGDAESNGPGLPDLKYGTIRDELPDGWELIPHDKIGNFYCGNMAFMAPNVNFFSAAIASDGCMDLVTMSGELSPVTTLRTLMSAESGKLLDSPHATYQKLSAYRIIPRNQDGGYISIDGESVPFEPFQAEVHPALGRVISKRGVFEADGPTDWEESATEADMVSAEEPTPAADGTKMRAWQQTRELEPEESENERLGLL